MQAGSWAFAGTSHGGQRRDARQSLGVGTRGVVAARTRSAKAARARKSRSYGRVFFCDAILEQESQDLKPMTPILRACIQDEHAVVGQRHLARQRHLSPTD
jgi:hypothetical protein